MAFVQLNILRRDCHFARTNRFNTKKREMMMRILNKKIWNSSQNTVLSHARSLAIVFTIIL